MSRRRVALQQRLIGRMRPLAVPIAPLASWAATVCQDARWAVVAHEALPYGRIILINSSILQSEAGSLYAARGDVVCVFSVMLADSKVTMSWRSHGGEARKIAEALGGGGHPNAAGATMPLEEFFAIPWGRLGMPLPRWQS